MVLTKEAASLQHEEDTAKTMNFVQAISAIQKQSNEYVRLLLPISAAKSTCLALHPRAGRC